MTAAVVQDVKLISLRGEAHRDLLPGYIDVHLDLTAERLAEHANLLTVSLSAEISATEAGHEEDPAEASPWATVAVRYAVELTEDLTDDLTEKTLKDLRPQLWPYVRSRCLDVLADLGITEVPIPFDPQTTEETRSE